MIPVARPSLSDADLAAVGEVFATRWLGLGKVTQEFEAALSERFSGRHVVATNTGTTAIELALRALDVGPGDEVIIPSLTFVATAQAVAATGARPVLCDIDRATLNVSATELEAARSPATKAVVPVHYRGLPAEIEPILEWARPHGIRVIEDAAHAFGSAYEDGTAVGALGDVTCFSFDPIKNITSGEGGAAVFADEAEHDRAMRMRVLGIDSTAWSRLEARRPWEYDVVDMGFRFHMPNFCAAIGLSQLDRFEGFREVKQSVLRRYQEALRDHPVLEVPEMPVDRCFPFLALVLVDERERFMAHMKSNGVGTGVHYQPLHRLSRFADAAANGVPVSEELGERICSLPLLADQTDAECERVLEAAASFQ
jgi:dTDP-4-amino-4,6-dideoxygalactose transaminase